MQQQQEAQGSTPMIAKQPTVKAGFEYDDRPVRDICWTVFFVVYVGLIIGFGIYSAANMHDDPKGIINQEYHEHGSFCPVSEAQVEEYEGRNELMLENAMNDNLTAPQRKLLQQGVIPTSAEDFRGAVNQTDFTFGKFLQEGWPWILGAAGAAVVLGFLFLLAFSYFASVMVYTVAALLITVPLVIGIVVLVSFDNNWGWAYIAAGIVIAIPIFCLHGQIRLSAKLLDLGADGIRFNLDLVFFSICSNLVMIACLAALMVGGVAALFNGETVPNDRANWTIMHDDPDRCVHRLSDVYVVDCCDYDIKNFVVGYWVLIIIMFVWLVFLFDQIKVYVVAGVVSQWYFADEENKGNMSILKSLRFALGQNFGSLVLSSLILTIARIIQRISQWLAKQAQEENSRFKWLAVCLSCLIGAIAHIIEWVTDFGTVRMAITGESFFTAGKNVVAMMKNNLINAYAIWWFPPIVLFICSFIISVSASVLLAVASLNAWDDDGNIHDARTWSVYLFFISFLLIMVVLNFFSTMLIDAANTIFVCFAIDKENKTQKNPKAHEVFASLGILDAVAGGSNV